MQMTDILDPIVERPAKVFINDKLIGEINTEYQLNRIRLRVAKQELHKVHFLFDDENGVTHRIDCHPTGHLNHWPKGFFDLTQNQLFELVSINK
jgi:predicted ATPase